MQNWQWWGLWDLCPLKPQEFALCKSVSVYGHWDRQASPMDGVCHPVVTTIKGVGLPCNVTLPQGKLNRQNVHRLSDLEGTFVVCLQQEADSHLHADCWEVCQKCKARPSPCLLYQNPCAVGPETSIVNKLPQVILMHSDAWETHSVIWITGQDIETLKFVPEERETQGPGLLTLKRMFLFCFVLFVFMISYPF